MLVAALVGCGGPPATHYYLLESTPRVDRSSVTAEGGTTVGVRPFQVDPPYDQDRIVYRVRDRSTEVGFYAYHRWATPLSRMLPRAVAAGLDDSVGVRLIEPVVSGRSYDGYLVGRVLAIEEVDHEGGQDVVLRIELGLRTANGTELWSDVLTAEDTIETREVGEIVEQMNRALGQAIEGVREEFGQAVIGLRVDD
jgi:uncharacterized lipoprotein YmbA